MSVAIGFESITHLPAAVSVFFNHMLGHSNIVAVKLEEACMAITGDRYVGTYEGHTIELIRNNWDKTLSLLIDGNKVATESRLLPHDITLTSSFEHNGVQHTVVAKASEHFLTAD